jgi:hypothetical protein
MRGSESPWRIRRLRRLEALHLRDYQFVFGRLALGRVVYGTREGQKIEYVPIHLPAITGNPRLLGQVREKLPVVHYAIRSEVCRNVPSRVIMCRDGARPRSQSASRSSVQQWGAFSPSSAPFSTALVLLSIGRDGETIGRSPRRDTQATAVPPSMYPGAARLLGRICRQVQSDRGREP